MGRPLPWRKCRFHAMSTYPYPESEKYPDDADALGLPVELERPLRFGRAGAFVPVRLSRRCRRRRRMILCPLLAWEQQADERSWCLHRRCGNLNCLRVRRGFCCGACRGTHPANRAAESRAECVCRLRCGTRACAGAQHDAWRGHRERRPLFGLPVTVKSSIATAGYRSAKSAACFTKAMCRARTQLLWRGYARRER